MGNIIVEGMEPLSKTGSASRVLFGIQGRSVPVILSLSYSLEQTLRNVGMTNVSELFSGIGPLKITLLFVQGVLDQNPAKEEYSFESSDFQVGGDFISEYSAVENLFRDRIREAEEDANRIGFRT